MVSAHILGYHSNESAALQFAQDTFRKDGSAAEGFHDEGRELCEQHWKKQKDAGLALITVSDFTLYDHVLDHLVLFGALPARFDFQGMLNEQDYALMVNGNEVQPAMEKARWFDTSDEYLVPELDADTCFSINAHDFLSRLDEVQTLNKSVKPVLLGPASLLYLSKVKEVEKLTLLDSLAEQYAYLLRELHHRKIEWVQIDEPIFALDLDDAWLKAIERSYAWFRTSRPKLLLTTYFANVARYQGYITHLPVDGVHIDLVRAPEQLAPWINALPGHWVLSAGVIDGRHTLPYGLDQTLAMLKPVLARLGDRLWLAPNCYLRNIPVTLAAEEQVDVAIQSSWGVADEKLHALKSLAIALHHDKLGVAA